MATKSKNEQLFLNYGNISIPYTKDPLSPSKNVFHLPDGIKAYTPFSALQLMCSLYIKAGVSFGEDFPTPDVAERAMLGMC